jgi:hypothetical protein
MASIVLINHVSVKEVLMFAKERRPTLRKKVMVRLLRGLGSIPAYQLMVNDS